MLEVDFSVKSLVLQRGYRLRRGAMARSLASDTVIGLADETILTSKFYTSDGVGGEEDDVGEVEVECK